MLRCRAHRFLGPARRRDHGTDPDGTCCQSIGGELVSRTTLEVHRARVHEAQTCCRPRAKHRPGCAPCPSDVSDEIGPWSPPYPTLLPDEAEQRAHSQRDVFDGLRHVVKTGAPGAGCRTTFRHRCTASTPEGCQHRRQGPRSISRPGAGWRPAASRPWPMICEWCCGWQLDERRSRALPSVDSRTLRSTRWDICGPCRSPSPVSMLAADGWSTDPLAGPAASGAWSRTTSAVPARSPVCISSPSPAACSCRPLGWAQGHDGLGTGSGRAHSSTPPRRFSARCRGRRPSDLSRSGGLVDRPPCRRTAAASRWTCRQAGGTPPTRLCPSVRGRFGWVRGWSARPTVQIRWRSGMIGSALHLNPAHRTVT